MMYGEMLPQHIIEKYELAGKITRDALQYGCSLLKTGIPLLEVATKVEAYTVDHGGSIAFPVNIAIDDIAAHFTPKHDDRTVFNKGNLVKLDIGVHIDGYIADAAASIEIATNRYIELIRAAQEALEIAIELIRPGVSLELIGDAIERTINSYGYVPISNLTGHSMERYKLHAGISIPNVKEHVDAKIKEGDVLAIEPFATTGTGKVKGYKRSNIYRYLRDRKARTPEAEKLLAVIRDVQRGLPFSERWCTKYVSEPSQVLRDLVKLGAITSYPILREMKNGMVAQSEHTVIVTANGCKIVTL
jgi:methionyl aminopeptidase